MRGEEKNRDHLHGQSLQPVPHKVKRSLAQTLMQPPRHLRVITPDVGGGFGQKVEIWPEDAGCSYLAMTLARPAVTCYGLEAAGLRSGMLLNGALSTLAHTAHLPMRDDLFAAMQAGGMRAFLDQHDTPFRPEPFGPKSTDNR